MCTERRTRGLARQCVRGLEKDVVSVKWKPGWEKIKIK